MSSSSKLYRLDGAHKDSILTVDWFRHVAENEVITGSVDERVATYRVSEQPEGAQGNISLSLAFADHTLGAISVVGNPKYPVAISSGMDSRIRILDLQGDAGIKSTMDVGPVECWRLACHPDGNTFASGTHSGAVNVWDLESEKLVQTLETQGGFVLCVAYSSDGTLLAAGTKDGVIFVFNLAQKKIVATITAHTMPVRALRFAPDSAILYSSSDDLTIGIFDAPKGAQIGSLRGHLSFVFDVAVSPDKKHIATASGDNTVKLWDVVERTCVHTFEKSHSNQVYSVSFNHDGTRLASVGGEGNLQIYSIV